MRTVFMTGGAPFAVPPSAGGGGGGGGGTVADPTQLPAGNAQGQDLTAYAATGDATAVGNTTYLEPTTGRRVCKLTSASYPSSNSGSRHEYSEGPNNAGCEWPGDVKHTLVLNVDGVGCRLVDYERGVGLDDASWRAAPGADTGHHSFSCVPATARIVYYINSSGVINRYDTDAMALANIGNFPSPSTGANTMAGWFQHDKDDEWFFWQDASGNIRGWNSQTGATRFLAAGAGADEFYLDLDGDYILVNANTKLIWDLAADTTSTYTPLTNQDVSHVPSLRGYFVTFNPNSGAGHLPFARVPAASPSSHAVEKNYTGYQPDGHNTSWVQAAADTTQWSLWGTEDVSGAWAAGSAPGDEIVENGFTYHSLDGQTTRFLGHSYTKIRGATGGSDPYWSSTRMHLSSDGKIGLYGTNMNDTARYDAHLIEIPVA